uniref:Uncharacterized protein n=1 Tax=Venturia canescens TaxID=32260 RepID=A0A0U1ZIW9_9HYME|nr:hypothetical protein [Venturia canescens]
MFVKFANTDGLVMDAEEPYTDTEIPLELGTCIFLPDGLVFVDRHPGDTATRLYTQGIIDCIRFAQQIYEADEGCQIHLPRMHSSLLAEAEVQQQLYKLAKKVNILVI